MRSLRISSERPFACAPESRGVAGFALSCRLESSERFFGCIEMVLPCGFPVWIINSLKDPVQSIFVASKVLSDIHHDSQRLSGWWTDSEMRRVAERYNGFGPDAARYGAQAMHRLPWMEKVVGLR